MPFKMVLFTIVGLIVAIFLICLLIPRSRKYYFYTVRYFTADLWEMMVDFTPSKERKVSLWSFLIAVVVVSLISILMAIPIIVIVPLLCLVRSITDPELVDSVLDLEKGIQPQEPQEHTKTPEELEAERIAYQQKLLSVQFEVPYQELGYEPSEREIIFYTPISAPEVEKEIANNLDKIKKIFAKNGYSFFFLPEFYQQINEKEGGSMLEYYNPRTDRKEMHPTDVLTYNDIKEALSMPERVNSPCFIRCKRCDGDPVPFSFWNISISGGVGIVEATKEYLSSVGDGRRFHEVSDKALKEYLEGLPADERFDVDVYLIGNEIRERINLLRAKGLSSLAIKKLIGDDSDKPGKLLIDKNNRLILTDYGNKEIKLSPLHKTVFFLFLRHPEGIYFKDLGDYKEELESIYGEITGREDKKAIADSIKKLTDPFDNSINEKCARIKNAFVSEFREEVAQWYFINGSKGEKKCIKLPRELVTWEIKD